MYKHISPSHSNEIVNYLLLFGYNYLLNDPIWIIFGMWVRKLALRRKPMNLHAKSQHSCSYSFRDLSVYTDKRTDGQTDMARSNRLVIDYQILVTLFQISNKIKFKSTYISAEHTTHASATAPSGRYRYYWPCQSLLKLFS